MAIVTFMNCKKKIPYTANSLFALKNYIEAEGEYEVLLRVTPKSPLEKKKDVLVTKKSENVSLQSGSCDFLGNIFEAMEKNQKEDVAPPVVTQIPKTLLKTTAVPIRKQKIKWAEPLTQVRLFEPHFYYRFPDPERFETIPRKESDALKLGRQLASDEKDSSGNVPFRPITFMYNGHYPKHKKLLSRVSVKEKASSQESKDSTPSCSPPSISPPVSPTPVAPQSFSVFENFCAEPALTVNSLPLSPLIDVNSQPSPPVSPENPDKVSSTPFESSATGSHSVVGN